MTGLSRKGRKRRRRNDFFVFLFLPERKSNRDRWLTAGHVIRTREREKGRWNSISSSFSRECIVDTYYTSAHLQCLVSSKCRWKRRRDGRKRQSFVSIGNWWSTWRVRPKLWKVFVRFRVDASKVQGVVIASCAIHVGCSNLFPFLILYKRDGIVYNSFR
jgi:hypothetical protein